MCRSFRRVQKKARDIPDVVHKHNILINPVCGAVKTMLCASISALSACIQARLCEGGWVGCREWLEK